MRPEVTHQELMIELEAKLKASGMNLLVVQDFENLEQKIAGHTYELILVDEHADIESLRQYTPEERQADKMREFARNYADVFDVLLCTGTRHRQHGKSQMIKFVDEYHRLKRRKHLERFQPTKSAIRSQQIRNRQKGK